MFPIQQKLRINPLVVIKKLINGKRYILIIKDSIYKPIFIKDIFIDLLEEIKISKCTYEEISKKYGCENLDFLIKAKLLVNYNEVNLEINLNCDYEKQSQRLNYLAFKTRTPLYAKFEITYRCNYRCTYCYVEDLSMNEMNLHQIKLILDKLNANGVIELFITGGEPFLHPDILSIIDYANSLEFIINIQTNGSFINKEIAEKLASYKHLKLAISYHSCSESKFDEFTRILGSFNRTLDSYKCLKENNLNCTFKYTTTVANEENTKENIEFLEKRNIKFQVYTQILPNIKDSKDNSMYSIGEESLRWLYENKYLSFNKRICSALKTKLWISPSGDLYPCELVREIIGNVLNEDFASIWSGIKAQTILNSEIYKIPDKCSKCSKEPYCNRCLAYENYYNWSGGLDVFCKTANIINKLIIQK